MTRDDDISGLPIIDGHNDALMAFPPVGEDTPREFVEGGLKGQFDLPRAWAGGVGGGFFAVFVPDEETKVALADPTTRDFTPPPLDRTLARDTTRAMVAALRDVEHLSGGRVRIVQTVAEMESCLRDGRFAAVLHFEGADLFDPETDPGLDTLAAWYEEGLRSLGIVWSRPTAFGYGVPLRSAGTPDTGPGLTDAGRHLVRACNELGILIDLAHLNEKGFWDVAASSDAPLVATHANAYTLSPSPRNLTDRQLDAIRDTDGMVGLALVVIFLNTDTGSDRGTPMGMIVRHIDYLVERVGLDRVGFGADFGPPTTPTPEVLADVSMYPRLIEALLAAGYDDAALRKITHENWLRVLRMTWK